MTQRLLLAAAVASVTAGSCKKPDAWSEKKVDPDVVDVVSDKLKLRTDTVGEGEHESTSTFVLVDAKNTHDEDLNVTLGGALLDDDGKNVATLRPDSLRIPAGKQRTFALLGEERGQYPSATKAEIEVVGAHVEEHAPTVRITEGHVHPDGDRIMASATVVNTVERTVKVVVIGTFYDENDVPLTRPFEVFQLDGNTSHPVHFRSPPGAKKGYIFTGQIVY